MKYVFELMQEKGINIDAVTYTSVMHWLSNAGDVDGAVNIWEEMKLKECYPTVVSYTAYMKILFLNDRVKEATDVYKEMIQSGLPPNCYTYTVLMEYLVGAGTSPRVDPAAQLEMEENIEMRSSGRPGVRSWVVRGTGGTRVRGGGKARYN